MRNNKKSIIYWLLLLSYCGLVAYLSFFKYTTPWELFDANRFSYRAINLIPFASLQNYLDFQSGTLLTKLDSTILGPILLFVPMGLYLQTFHPVRRLFSAFRDLLILSFLIETVKYLLELGTANIDELILHALGGLAGIILGKLCLIVLRKMDRINVAVTCFTLIVLLSIAVLNFCFPGMFI